MTREERIKSALLPILEKMREHGATDEMCKMYDNGFHVGAMWADQHPHWISVEDGLPPKNEAYLAYWQHLGVTKYRFIKSGAKVSRFFSEYITHWMPLPQPPKGGDKE